MYSLCNRLNSTKVIYKFEWITDIINQLITKKPQLLRPIVAEDACTPELMSLMKSCWCDEPSERPSFNDIDEVYKKMRRYWNYFKQINISGSC
jgi:hypothetical protein